MFDNNGKTDRYNVSPVNNEYQYNRREMIVVLSLHTIAVPATC